MTLSATTDLKEMGGAAASRPAAAATPAGAGIAAFPWMRLAPYALLLAACFRVFTQTQDDPFITFRYAHNVVSGYGPVFNPGERVEGYSSPLHLALCCVLLWIFPGAGVLFKAKLLSLLFAALTLMLTPAAARRMGIGAGGAVFAQTLTAVNVNFAIAAVNGLETTLYGFLLLAAFCRFVDADASAGWHSGIFVFLCLLARPDALLVALLLSAAAIIKHARRGHAAGAGAFLAAVWIPAAIMLAARLTYYGSLLPNTYYAKMSGAHVLARDAIGYLAHPLTASPAPSLAKIGDLAAFYGLAAAGLWTMRRRPAALLGAGIVACAALFVLSSGGDWMPGWRFMAPALPLLALLQAQGAGCAAAGLGRKGMFAAVALVWALPNVRHWDASWASVGMAASDRALMSHGLFASAWTAGADYVARHTAPGQMVAYSEMGYAPWVNLDRRFLDTRGLTDRQVARVPGKYKDKTGVTDARWMDPGSPVGAILSARRPDLILVLDIPTRAENWRPVTYPRRVLGNYFEQPRPGLELVAYAVGKRTQ